MPAFMGIAVSMVARDLEASYEKSPDDRTLGLLSVGGYFNGSPLPRFERVQKIFILKQRSIWSLDV